MTIKGVYFAHPVNIYDTPLEMALERFIIHMLFKDDTDAIENPNQPHHQVGYTDYAARAKQSDVKHKGMNYFYDVVLPNCESCVAFPFLDGLVGLGVAGEARWFAEHGQPVWFIEPTRVPTARELNEFIVNPLAGDLFRIRLFTVDEIELLLKSDPKLVVPHIATRLRTWKVYNRVKLPYEEAHLAPTEVPPGFYPEG